MPQVSQIEDVHIDHPRRVPHRGGGPAKPALDVLGGGQKRRRAAVEADLDHRVEEIRRARRAKARHRLIDRGGQGRAPAVMDPAEQEERLAEVPQAVA